MSRKIVFMMDGKEVFFDEKSSRSTNSAKSNEISTKSKRKVKKVENVLTSKNSSPDTEEYLQTASPILKKAIIECKPIAKDILQNEEFTTILRLASIKNTDGASRYPNIYEAVTNELKLRPLPIKLYVGDDKSKVIKLHQHQIDTIHHMIAKERAVGEADSFGLSGSILRLEMGLGKTLIAITHSLIAQRPSYSDEKYGDLGFPTLIVASKMVLREWKTEGFEKFFGDSVKVLYYHKSFMSKKEYDTVGRQDIIKYDFVITTYDAITVAAKQGEIWRENVEEGVGLQTGKIVSIHPRSREQTNNPLIKGHHIFFFTPWERVIIDESHRASNHKTFAYKALMTVYGKYKFCLTGTPLRNNSSELWAQFRLCGYTGVTREIQWKRIGISMMREQKLNRYILSIDTKQTDIKLPKKVIKDYTNTFEGNEKKVYDFVLKIARDIYDEMMANLVNFANVLALFTRLRQLCIAPYLITAESKREKLKGEELANDNSALNRINNLTKGPLSTWIFDKKGTAGMKSSKMQLILKTIQDIPQGEKVLIFSMFTSCLDLIRDTLNEFAPEFVFEQLDGDTKDSEKDDIKHAFKTKPAVRGLLMTYKVGSEGLNLTEGNHVICVEPWWTPTVGLQAEGRCHRPGQTKEVKVHRIYIKDSIEDKILTMCKEKAEMARQFLNGTHHTKTGMDKETLRTILFD